MVDAREIQPEELTPLSTGAWILGAGGGGSPYYSYLNVREQYKTGIRINLIDPKTLGDNDLVAVVSSMGAPLVGQERLRDHDFAAKPVRMMEEYLGRKFDAVMALEIGGANALQPLMVATVTGLPIVDADAMGRAFPEAQMTSFAIGDLQMFPLCLADIRDNETIVARAASWKWMERISRKICTEVGSTAATCKAPRSGKEVKDWGILYTTTRAIDLGRVVEDARVSHEDPIKAALDHEGGVLLFKGKITDIDRRATEGFLRGSATIDGLDEDTGSEFRLEFQNEFAIGLRDGVPAATVPELICVMDTLSGEAIGTETLRYGQRVSIIALPADPILTSERGLQNVGPRAFGYDMEFESLFGAGETR
jgi:DUF917 family protein